MQTQISTGRAIRQFQAWLEAVGIPFRSESSGVTLSNADGTEMQVQFVDGAEVLSDSSLSLVPAHLLTSRDRSVAFGAFHAVTRAAGYGEPVPVDRGAEPNRRLTFADSFWDVALRHRELHRAPNPSPEKMKKYAHIVARACWRFMRMNQDLCERQGWEFEDVQTLANMWLVNFCGHFEVANPTQNQNEGMLTNYLNQRFYDLFKLVRLKNKSQLPDLDTFQYAVFGHVFRPRSSEIVDSSQGNTAAAWPDQNDPRNERVLRCLRCDSRDLGYVTSTSRSKPNLYVCNSCGAKATEWKMEHSDVDEAFLRRRNEMGCYASDAGRRKLADNLLTRKLAEMPHDRMVSALTAIIDNEDADPGTRREARYRLAQHAKTCSSCACSSIDSWEEDEEAVSEDALCVSE